MSTALLNDSVLLGSERYPLAGQDATVMPYVVAAVRKVYAALDELVATEKV